MVILEAGHNALISQKRLQAAQIQEEENRVTVNGRRLIEFVPIFNPPQMAYTSTVCCSFVCLFNTPKASFPVHFSFLLPEFEAPLEWFAPFLPVAPSCEEWYNLGRKMNEIWSPSWEN